MPSDPIRQGCLGGILGSFEFIKLSLTLQAEQCCIWIDHKHIWGQKCHSSLFQTRGPTMIALELTRVALQPNRGSRRSLVNQKSSWINQGATRNCSCINYMGFFVDNREHGLPKREGKLGVKRNQMGILADEKGILNDKSVRVWLLGP